LAVIFLHKKGKKKMKKKIINIVFFAHFITLGMEEVEPYKFYLSTYQMVMNIRDMDSKKSEFDEPLNDKVHKTLITIVGRDEQADHDFFSFLFPESFDMYKEIPKFIFTDLFENQNVYEYYKAIFEEVVIEGKIDIRAKGIFLLRPENLLLPVDYTLYRMGKKFFTILLCLQQKKIYDDRNNLTILAPLYAQSLKKILCQQVAFLFNIVATYQRYDILSFEKINHFLFSNANLKHYNVRNAYFKPEELRLKKDAERMYGESIKEILKEAIKKNCHFIIENVDAISFMDLFISLYKSREKGSFIEYSLELTM